MIDLSSPVALALAVLLAAVLLWQVYAFFLTQLSIPFIATTPFLGSVRFWTARGDFLTEGVKRFGSVFGFKVMRHTVYCVTGPQAREVFYKTPENSVSFTLGYKHLFTGTPKNPARNQEEEKQSQEQSKTFHTHIVKMLNKSRIDAAIPQWVNDIVGLSNRIGDKGKMEPFLTVYRTVFQMSCRLVACQEMYENFSSVEKMNDLFWKLESGTSARATLFPEFLPCKERTDARAANIEMYKMMAQIVDARKKSNQTYTDPLQYLMEVGMSTSDVLGFILNALFAAVINTGIMSCWMLLHLVENKEWRDRVMAEFYAAMKEKGCNEGLSSITVDLLESLPTLEVCLKETLRVSLCGATLRKVVDPKGVTVDGKHLPYGSFMCNPISDVHMDEKVYSQPEKFDPARFLPPRSEQANTELSFLGWGIGKHPCLGMKTAMYEIKVLVLSLLCMYDFEITSGPLPAPDRNNFASAHPNVPVVLSYVKKDKFGYTF